jgi:lysozyme
VQISDAGINLIKASEGFVGHTYPDSHGKDAIGYGHNLHQGESYPNGITEAQATVLLQQDCAYAEYVVSTSVKVKIAQSQFDALVCFVYNLGATTFLGSTLFKYLNAGSYTLAATQFPIWDHLDGKDCRGLLKRRLNECLLFLSNLPADKPPAA